MPGAKKEQIEQRSEDQFVISVKEKAQRNLANNRVVELLAKYFDVPANRVRLVSGHRSMKKVFTIESA